MLNNTANEMWIAVLQNAKNDFIKTTLSKEQ